MTDTAKPVAGPTDLETHFAMLHAALQKMSPEIHVHVHVPTVVPQSKPKRKVAAPIAPADPGLGSAHPHPYVS